MSYGDDAGKRKRIAIISLSSIFLVAMVIAIIKKNVSRVLHSEAGNATDYKALIKAGFKVAINHINEAAKKSTVLQGLEKDPRAKKALDSCKELMDSSISELKHSFNLLGDFDVTKIDKILIDLKVWLSAAITYQETCLDGFQNTTSDAGEKMKKALRTAMRLSSNGLAMVSDLSKVFTDFNIKGLGRRLLQEDLPVLGHGELPEWINLGLRRLLQEEFPVLGHGELPEWINPGLRRLLQASPAAIKPDIIVAKDGSGRFKTINEALPLIPKNGNKTFVIYIKEGVYREYVQINSTMTHVLMIGDGPQKTRITGNKNFVDGIPTFKTCTVAVSGDYFIAKNIGFENSAGPEKHQAVALKVQSDLSVFYNCSMDGYQDTLYVHTKRQFYRDCTISGTIDFVFGDAASVFQNCTFLVRKPMDNQQCIVTAQGRKERRQPSAIVLQGCTILADPALYQYRFERKVYLGRPWKEYSRTIIMESYLDDLIQPTGWLPWMGDFGLKTCFYTEFDNIGPGAVNSTHRVKWRGIKNITRKHALDFAPGRFLRGDSWIKSTGVPYSSGFITTASSKLV
uniref:Pectinesterase n=1 Tax=Fagus sylvatica TaxID=28930 RepID=A0A2N9GUH6_FAGSY